MTIQEAMKAHEAGKKVRNTSWSKNVYVDKFGSQFYTTNQSTDELFYLIDDIQGEWEILEEPLTVDDYQKGLEFILNKFNTPNIALEFLLDLKNGKRFWEEGK